MIDPFGLLPGGIRVGFVRPQQDGHSLFKMSRSVRSRSFSRRSREISAAESRAEGGADAGIGGRADPGSRPPLPLRQLRSIEGEIPSSLAIRLNGRPLLPSRAIASRLNSSVK